MRVGEPRYEALGGVLANPFCELGPAVADQVLRILRRHCDGAIGADVEVPSREGLHGPDAGRDSTAQFLDWFKKPFPGQCIFEFYRMQAGKLQRRKSSWVRLRASSCSARASASPSTCGTALLSTRISLSAHPGRFI